MQENLSDISTDCIKAEQCPDTNVSRTNYTEAWTVYLRLPEKHAIDIREIPTVFKVI